MNEAPTNITVSNTTIAENAATGTVIGIAATTDPDAGGQHAYSLTNTAGGRFAIDSTTGQITVANGSLLNYEAAKSHSITVRTTDQGGLSRSQTFTIALTNVNEAPTDLTLSVNTVRENAGTGTVVGKVTAVDADAGDTRTYSLTDTAGGRFAINATTGQLTVANGALLNYEAATSHAVTVRVTDSGGLSVDKTFTIALTNVNEAPTGADAASAKDMAAVLTAAAFGSRSIGETSNPTSPALSLSSQVDADGFRPSDTIQKPTIVLATETPLTMDIPASERAGDSEKFIENVVIQEKAERLPSPEETRESEGQGETSEAPPVVVVNADRRDLSEPGNAAENSDESIALQLSETVGLAGIASQSAVGAKTKLRALISRPAPGLTTSPDQTVQQPAGKDPASNPTASEQP